MASDVRWGIMGLGWMGNQLAEDIAQTPGATLVAAAARDADRAQAFAARHGAARHYADYRDLARDPDVDIVYIATPHSHHYEHARMMLEHGKAVLIEKPMTMNADEARQLVALAREKRLFLMEALWTLCNPLILDLLAAIRGGAIGEPQAFLASIGPAGIPSSHRTSDPALGGSYLLETLVYPMALLNAFAPDLAKAEHVSAASVRSATGADSHTAVMLRSKTGMATMAGGYALDAQGGSGSALHLFGSHGWMTLNDNLFNPGEAMLAEGSNQPRRIADSGNAARYRWEIEEAMRCWRNGLIESPMVPHDSTVTVMDLLDRARAAAAGLEQ